MIDLHIHLEGSIRPETLLALAKEQGIYMPTVDEDELKGLMRRPNEGHREQTYQKRFVLGFSVLQERKAIRRAVYELIKDLDAQGILYAEIRMIPQYHVLKGLSQEQVVDAALAGMLKGMEESGRIRANLILCTVRGADEKDNFATIVEAKEHLRKGVAGMDLVGNGRKYPTQMYVEQFELLNQEGIPFCVHAGADADPESIRIAVEHGALRIGHGIRVLEDPALVQLLIDRRITIEVCASSNIQRGLVPEVRKHPARDLYEAGVRIAVCTDDKDVCDTTMRQEYALLQETFGWTREDFLRINRYAIDGSFISAMEKERLRNQMDEMYCKSFAGE